MSGDDLPVFFKRAFIRQLSIMGYPTAQHHGQRSISCQPLAIILACQVDVCAGRLPALAGWMTQGSIRLHPGAGRDTVLVRRHAYTPAPNRSAPAHHHPGQARPSHPRCAPQARGLKRSPRQSETAQGGSPVMGAKSRAPRGVPVRQAMCGPEVRLQSHRVERGARERAVPGRAGKAAQPGQLPARDHRTSRDRSPGNPVDHKEHPANPAGGDKTWK